MLYFILLDVLVIIPYTLTLLSYFISYSLLIVTTFTLYFIYEATLHLN